ncbi:MAG TPA: helix-turn-helix transcriptional regulator [Solirubrobacterales bacterium]|nr:helix-turn-helix transcriptional regulator [Solirubrobacterales bacterium]
MPEPDIAKRFSENLSRARERSGLTQEALAQTAEIHRTQIGELLRGNQLPRLDTLLRLAGALNVEPADLLDGLSFEPSAPGRYKVKPGKR